MLQIKNDLRVPAMYVYLDPNAFLNDYALANPFSSITATDTISKYSHSVFRACFPVVQRAHQQTQSLR